jgi:hypothetical protein
MESFMEVGQGTNWGCSIEGKKYTHITITYNYRTVIDLGKDSKGALAHNVTATVLIIV